MGKINDLLATEGEAAENVSTPDDGHRRNLNRSVMFSVRFNPSELEELQHYAEQRGLPARTLARAWILERMREETGQGDSLSQRVARLEEAISARSA
jgi:hypothetical protein